MPQNTDVVCGFVSVLHGTETVGPTLSFRAPVEPSKILFPFCVVPPTFSFQWGTLNELCDGAGRFRCDDREEEGGRGELEIRGE